MKKLQAVIYCLMMSVLLMAVPLAKMHHHDCGGAVCMCVHPGHHLHSHAERDACASHPGDAHQDDCVVSVAQTEAAQRVDVSVTPDFSPAVIPAGQSAVPEPKVYIIHKAPDGYVFHQIKRFCSGAAPRRAPPAVC